MYLAQQIALRNCSAAENGRAVSAQDTSSAVPWNEARTVDAGAEPGKEARLEELKRLFYLKYLSKGAYSEMKKGILESP